MRRVIVHKLIELEQADSCPPAEATALHTFATAYLRALIYGVAESFIMRTSVVGDDADDAGGIRYLFNWVRSVAKHEHQEKLLALDGAGSGLLPSEAVTHMIKVIGELELRPDSRVD
jgi:hypothetical protein